VCDRAYILNEGRILEAGSPKKIAASQKAREIYLGEHFRLERRGRGKKHAEPPPVRQRRGRETNTAQSHKARKR
jgi:ABC-type multidrug transport system ATPase subunit